MKILFSFLTDDLLNCFSEKWNGRANQYSVNLWVVEVYKIFQLFTNTPNQIRVDFLHEGPQNLLSIFKFKLLLDTWKPFTVKRRGKEIATRAEFAAKYPRIT